jgi:hypothetical protein
MTTMHFDDAFDFLIDQLAALPEPTGYAGNNARMATYGCDLWVPKVVVAYWQRVSNVSRELTDEHYRPFYDAAWDLARIGVLRLGHSCRAGRQWAGSYSRAMALASRSSVENGSRPPGTAR